jgi:hypothetical protein
MTEQKSFVPIVVDILVTYLMMVQRKQGSAISGVNSAFIDEKNNKIIEGYHYKVLI